MNSRNGTIIATSAIAVLVAVAVFATIGGCLVWYFGGLNNTRAYLRGDSVVVEPTSVDLGVLAPGEKASAQIVMTNLSSQPARILGANINCDFRIDVSMPFEIAPRSSQTVNLLVHVPRCSPDIDMVYFFFLQDSLVPVRVAVRAKVGGNSTEPPNASE